MPPSAHPGSKSPNIDLRRSLLETFAISEKVNQLLLTHVPEAAWRVAPPTGKGRSIGSVAVHIHQVRRLWLKAADKTGKHPATLDTDKAARAVAGALLEKALNDPAGKVSNCKPDVVALLGYLISHDSDHRGQIAMLARQVGHSLPPKAGFALWEWGTLWRERGFGK